MKTPVFLIVRGRARGGNGLQTLLLRKSLLTF